MFMTIGKDGVIHIVWEANDDILGFLDVGNVSDLWRPLDVKELDGGNAAAHSCDVTLVTVTFARI